MFVDELVKLRYDGWWKDVELCCGGIAYAVTNSVMIGIAWNQVLVKPRNVWNWTGEFGICSLNIWFMVNFQIVVVESDFTAEFLEQQ